MGTQGLGKGVSTLLGGRWQAPAAIVAVAFVVLSLYHLRPPERVVPFEMVVGDLAALVEAGKLGDAANAAANLLDSPDRFSRSELATLHNTLSDVVYRQEQLRNLPNSENVRLLLKHHEEAIRLGLNPRARDIARAAMAHEWLGATEPATQGFRAVLSRDPDEETRRTALQSLVRLLEGRPEHEAERRQRVEQLLAEPGVPLAYLWWSLQNALQEAFDHGDLPRARATLEQFSDRFRRSDLQGYYHYLWGWLLLAEGAVDEARPRAAWVADWLRAGGAGDTVADGAAADTASWAGGATSTEMDKAGFLPALSRWLSGAIELADARPQEALARFEEALTLQPYGDLAVRASIGRAEALAMLERHTSARDEIRSTIGKLQSPAIHAAAALPRLRQCLLSLHESRERIEDYEHAVEYLALALELCDPRDRELRLRLLDRLGKSHALAAMRDGDPATRRGHYSAAGAFLEQAAGLAQFDDSVRATLLWQSAQHYDASGRLNDVRRMLAKFVEGRTVDPRLPGALLQLGQSLAAAGYVSDAIRTYARLISEFTPLEEALRARLLTAECYVNMGPEQFERAESLLMDLLEGEHAAPDAHVFRDALFALCDLYFEQRRFSAVIGRAEDFLTFYPRDPERYRIQFMLADAYRQSAYVLRDGGYETARREQALETSRRRFQRAAELFAAYLADPQVRAEPSPAEPVYERWAMLYRGDCLFEINEPATLEEALATFRQAAARYQTEPAALTSQIQIANIYLRQGLHTEAARAIERARWLLQSMPSAAFEEASAGMTRDEWDRYLTSLVGSQLLRDVFASAD